MPWIDPLIRNWSRLRFNLRQPIWKIIWIVSMIISFIFLWLEHQKYSSNFGIILTCCSIVSISLFLTLKSFRINFRFRDHWELPLLLTIIGLVVSFDNDVVTQSDGQLWNVLKRIYVKETKVDVSQEFNKYTKPNLVIVLDMSGSTRQEKIDRNSLFYTETDYWYERLNSALTTAGITPSDKEQFLQKIKPSQKQELTEYDVYKLKLLDFVSKMQKRYDISIVCFGKYPIPSNTYSNENPNTLNEVFYFIKNYEKDIDKKQKTNFVNLFEKLIEEYDSKGEKVNINKAPKYSYVFFSDYIHESINATSKTDLENIITKFSKSPNFNNFYYFEGKDYEKSTTKGINIYPILKQSFREESGKFSSLTENYTELFDISSNMIIPLYYEYAFGEHKSKTKIIFDSIKHPFVCDISLENNIEHRRNHHHQFYFSINKEKDKQIFPEKDIKLDSTDIMILSFEGRVIDQFPGHSLDFYFEGSKGYCKFDIVFFKDFPIYVRYITSFLIIFIGLGLILLIEQCLKSTRQNRISQVLLQNSMAILLITTIILFSIMITLLIINNGI